MREIILKGAKNTRDFGGITNSEGKTVKSGMFIRGASLNKITKKDTELLFDKHRIHTVIDLRTEKEIAEKPDRIPPDVTYYHIPVVTDRMLGVTFEKDQNKNYQVPDLRNLYANIVTSETSIQGLKKVFEIICDSEDGGILWHCTQGKDRCGIVSALFLTLLDVDRHTIYRDYLMTNHYSRKRATRYYRLIITVKRDKPLARKIYKVFIAHRCYLRSAFDAISEKYGSVDAFIENELGITAEMKARIKARCLKDQTNK